MTCDQQESVRPPCDGVTAPRGLRDRWKLVAAAAAAAAAVGVGLLSYSLWQVRDDWPVWSSIDLAQEMEKVVPIDEPPMAAGRRIFEANCVRCHGPEGRGDGPDIANARVRPRDLASSAWRSRADRADVHRVILEGTSDRTMPALVPEVSPQELDSLVDYVLSLEVNGLLAKAGFYADLGRIAPPLAFRDVSGNNGSLERFRGKLVLVAFWGTTCAPCLAELPELESLAERYGKMGLVVLPACVDETDARAAGEVAARNAPDLPVYIVPDTAVRQRFRVYRLPQAVLVDRDGRILGSSNGERRWKGAGLENLLSSCLGIEPTLASQTGSRP